MCNIRFSDGSELKLKTPSFFSFFSFLPVPFLR
uniref:Uncharacterized protein n=1 Tax=Anguilla anguilla TaxID=7936 RepID=A0A0E9SY26_ANGAN